MRRRGEEGYELKLVLFGAEGRYCGGRNGKRRDLLDYVSRSVLHKQHEKKHSKHYRHSPAHEAIAYASLPKLTLKSDADLGDQQ